jgi:RsiW-degrading membrane proteinase PrsW (M82 family)
LLFLLLIYVLDLYASSTFRLVLVSFAWGALGGAGLSYLVNTRITIPLIAHRALDYLLLYVLFAPVVEEVFKSLVLFDVSRRSAFTYFVDGAVYGFAAGIGFSISENLLYMSYYPARRVALAFLRAFSVCLMHGTATGLVGVAVGRFRFRRRNGRRLAMIVGWIAAILLHAGFNSISQTEFLPRGWVVPTQVGIGLTGVGLMMLVILVGLREQREWIAEILREKIGMTEAEVRGAQASGDLEQVLRPIVRQFPKEAELLESLLQGQARLGIKQKVLEKTQDPKLEVALGQEVAELEDRTQQLRLEMGLCTKFYMQCVFPQNDSDAQTCLEDMVACTYSQDEDMQAIGSSRS